MTSLTYTYEPLALDPLEKGRAERKIAGALAGCRPIVVTDPPDARVLCVGVRLNGHLHLPLSALAGAELRSIFYSHNFRVEADSDVAFRFVNETGGRAKVHVTLVGEAA